MGELFKTQHTIDEMLDKMGVKIDLIQNIYLKRTFWKHKKVVKV